jgi:hypothetical protein
VSFCCDFMRPPQNIPCYACQYTIACLLIHYKRCLRHAINHRQRQKPCQYCLHHRRHIEALRLPLLQAPNTIGMLLPNLSFNIDKSIQKKSPTSAVMTGCRKSQRLAQKEDAVAAVAAAEQQPSRMFAQYRERKAAEEARLNAQYIGMMRYLKLCY